MINKNDNQYFERHAEDYADKIMATQPAFYHNSGLLINQELSPSDVVLDIGNGGVINYDYSRLSWLDCADLAISQNSVQKYRHQNNIRFLQADALNLTNIQDSTYDVAIIQAVIHHLAGQTRAQCLVNATQAMSEILRVLKPGGKILIIESTVVGWFEAVERILYPFMQLFFNLAKFGRIYQFSAKSLSQLVSILPGSNLAKIQPIDIGPRIWIMGKSVPTWLTPCNAVFIKVDKG